jgi:hypothetical protein
VTVDSNNQTVGFGNPMCFGEWQDINDLRMCPSGTTHCAVDIEVDWFQNGEQQTRVRRGCAPREEEVPMYEECRTAVSQNQLFMYKDCTGYCNMTACNSDTFLAAEKFLTGIAYVRNRNFYNFSNMIFRRRKAASHANTAKKTTETFSATSFARTSRTSSSTLRSDARFTTISAATLEPTRIT